MLYCNLASWTGCAVLCSHAHGLLCTHLSWSSCSILHSHDCTWSCDWGFLHDLWWPWATFGWFKKIHWCDQATCYSVGLCIKSGASLCLSKKVGSTVITKIVYGPRLHIKTVKGCWECNHAQESILTWQQHFWHHKFIFLTVLGLREKNWGHFGHWD